MKEFDVCLLSTTDVTHDARCLNLARTLAEAGKKVAIIAPNTNSTSIDSVQIINVSPSPSQRAYAIWKHFTAEVKYLESIKAKIICAMDIYALTASYRLVRSSKAKFYYDAREIYSAIGSLSKKWLKQMLQTEFEKYYARKIDRFIVSGRLDAEFLKKHFNTEKDFLVLLNLPPRREPMKSNILREKYSIGTDKQIIIYQGVLVDGRGIKRTIDALEYLPDCVFCLMGWSPTEDEYRQYAATKSYSERVIFCGSVPYDELHAYTSSADIGMCFIEPISFSYELALPNKLFEYAMAGLPTLVSDLPAMREIIDKHNTGLIISPKSQPKELAEKIKELIERKNEIIHNCDLARDSFSYESQRAGIVGFF
jgi:glycosyltransferase involved in cell wall biosynthesis